MVEPGVVLLVVVITVLVVAVVPVKRDLVFQVVILHLVLRVVMDNQMILGREQR